MIFGIYHSTLNSPGGAEFVTLTMINALKKEGHTVVVLTDEKIDQSKVMSLFGRKVSVDRQIILPNFFSPYSWDLGAIYNNVLRSLFLRFECDTLIDTCSNSLFPWVDVAYIHFPCSPPILSMRDNLYLPYYSLVRKANKKTQSNQKLVFVNSKYIAKVLMNRLGIKAHVLFPPVPTIPNSLESMMCSHRTNTVVTISRISAEKNLEIIPKIAKLTEKNICFVIIGGCKSRETLRSILRLAKNLGVSNRVNILTDLTRNELKNILLTSKVYLHTMKKEHFGISIIEGMSAGCIPIVHDGGGPREFVPKNLRYKNVEEAKVKIETAMSTWSVEYAEKMSHKARAYDEENFSKKFIKMLYSSISRM